MLISVFQVNEYQGVVTESEEMRPEWFDFDKIPYESMWKDDKHWLPYLIQQK